jgi:hypothetical protein
MLIVSIFYVLEKKTPTRLRAEFTPQSEFGVVRVDGFGSQSLAGGVE